jgi:predicted transcriptional regulator
MPELTCTLSSGLWRLLQQYSEKTNQPAAHIVSKALADFFDTPITRLAGSTSLQLPRPADIDD